MSADSELFSEKEGIFVPREGIDHRDEDYDQRSFDVLVKMQHKHFWYQGRHRFLNYVFHKELSRVGHAY